VLDQYAEGTYPTDNNTGAEQLAWLEADLNSTSAPWKFIVLHEPGYSAGGTGHSDNDDVKEDIQPLCEQYGVDIVFAGHNHYYARCEVNDVVHITAGGGGAPLAEPNENYSAYVQECNSVYHFCKIAISDCQLDFEVVDVNGEPVDSFTLVHEPNKAANPDVSGPTGEPNAIDSTLSWTPGELATSHDVYFGSDPNKLRFMCNTAVDVNRFDTRRMYGFLFADNNMTNIGPLTWTYEIDANIIYVDLDANGAGDGTSWEDAFTDVNSALSAASSGDEIWVAEGTYYPTDTNDRSISIQLEPNVALYGGFIGAEITRDQRNWKAHETILSGDIGTLDNPADNSYNVVIGADNAILDGFTITGGNGSDGGGIYCYGTSPIISNCVITANSAGQDGGGIYNDGGALKVTNCVFSENSADTGAGPGGGGGMYNRGGSAVIVNCVFSGNYSDAFGGGMFSTDCNPIVTNCTFSGNWAYFAGGAIYSSGTATPALSNCILWGDGAGSAGDEIEGSPTVTYSNVQGGYSGVGNSSADPNFADPNDPTGPDAIFGTLDDGLRLTAGSDCIDSGDNNAISLNTDIIGNIRKVDDPDTNDAGSGTAPIVDRGAYEYNSNPVYQGPYQWAQAYGITESQYIVGVSYNPNSKSHAFLTIPSEGSDPNMVDLHPSGDPNESAAYGISDANWIVGSIGDKAFLMKYPDSTDMTKLSSIFSEGDNNSVARAISNEGPNSVAVGWSGGYAVYWDSLDSNDPNIHILGTLGPYSKSRAYDVSEYGGVAGYYYPMFEDEPNDRAFIGDLDSGLTDIGTLEQGSVSRAYGISDAGQVIGEATIDSNDDQLRAFVYEKGQMYDLNKLVRVDTNEPNWVIASARSISDEGHIVGYGRLSDTNDPNSNYNRALLLVPVPEPVGHWRLDEHSGNMAMDASPSGNHGQLNGPTWTAGKIRGALTFDGVDDYVDCGNDNTLNLDRGSWGAWVKLNAKDNHGRVIFKEDSDANGTYELFYWQTSDRFEAEVVVSGVRYQAVSSGGVNIGQWYHLFGTYNGEILRLYVDGQKVDSEPAPSGDIDDSTGPLGVGSSPTDPTWAGFEGIIDDVRIYPYVLTQEEITALFDGGSWD